MRTLALARASASLSSLLPTTASATFSSTFATLSPSPSPRPSNKLTKLTPAELTQANLLIPRLCCGDRLREAVRLVDVCLLADTPIQSLSLPVLVSRLSSNPDSSHAMALLNSIKHNPRASLETLFTLCSMLLTSYFKNRRPREAMAVFRWMGRQGSSCPLDPEVYKVVVIGLCRNGRTFDALKVVRNMVGGGADLVPGPEVRACVYRSLLREARLREALEVEKALVCLVDGGGESVDSTAALLDRMITEWEE